MFILIIIIIIILTLWLLKMNTSDLQKNLKTFKINSFKFLVL